MNEGDVVIVGMPQVDGTAKNRPAVYLREMPPFGDLLVCGVSTRLHQAVKGFDDEISSEDADFQASGLVADSLIRLGFVTVISSQKVVGSIGSISTDRHEALSERLSAFLVEKSPKR